MTEHSDLLFLDTETLGLDPYAPIWELAAVRRRPDGTESQLHIQVSAHRSETDRWLSALDERFAADYRTRFRPESAATPFEAAHLVAEFASGRPVLIGSNPGFDDERVRRQWLEPLGIPAPWHYHLFDIATLALGRLAACGSQFSAQSSDTLSRRLGVDPGEFARHTAMGDVRWSMACWDAVFAPVPIGVG